MSSPTNSTLFSGALMSKEVATADTPQGFKSVESLENTVEALCLDETTPDSSDAHDTSDESIGESREFQKNLEEKSKEHGIGLSYEPEEYSGTMIKPLSLFGCFDNDIDAEIRELKWISDHTSGSVHKDMATISMLYNQDLTLPEAAEKFISQSPKLLAEARWERSKAAFYGFYPKDIQNQVYEVLSSLSALEASRVIAKKTSRFANEVLFQAIYDRVCESGDAEKFNQEFPVMESQASKILITEFEAFNKAENKLKEYNTFESTPMEPVKPTYGAPTKREHDFQGVSKQWLNQNQEFQFRMRNLVESRIRLFHFQHAEARYDPRTQWIHVKTQVMVRDSKETESLPEKALEVPLFKEDQLTGTVDEINKAIVFQMKRFEVALNTFGKGYLKEFESLHNDESFEEFVLSFPYSITPRVGINILHSHFLNEPSSDHWKIVSKPEVPTYSKQSHEMRVYLDMRNVLMPRDINSRIGSTLRLKNFGFCLNCYAKTHHHRSCPKAQYGFTFPVN